MITLKDTTGIIALTALVIAVLALATPWFKTPQPAPVYTLDIAKIVRAKMVLSGKELASGQHLNTLNPQLHIRQALRQIVPKNATVLVAQAAIQGATDVTTQVLKILGLPTVVPTALPQGALQLTPSLTPLSRKHPSLAGQNNATQE